MVLDTVFISACVQRLSFKELQGLFDSAIAQFAMSDPDGPSPTPHSYGGRDYLITSMSDIATGDEVVVIFDVDDLKPRSQ